MKFMPADRIGSLKPYFFAHLGKRIADIEARGVDVVRMDIGSPDMPPAPFIIEALVERAGQPDAHGYTAFGGTPAYRAAVAEYYGRRFGVEVDPRKNICGLIGSKEGIFTLNQIALNPGDLALVPDPGYSTYAISAAIAGADVHTMPLLAENHFLPDLAAIPADIARRAKVLWLNYPNNPTGAVASREFFAEVIEFARTYDLLVAHDTPYVDVCYGGYRAPSILEIPGALDWAVEFNSLSKAYNMAGWRLGMAVGNPDVVGYIERYKSQKDTAHFEPALYAGIRALTGDQGWLEARNRTYERRLLVIRDALEEMGLDPNIPRAALYTWTPVPAGMDDVTFCERLLNEAGVSTTPGSVFGPAGRGYFRMSICTPEDRTRLAMQRMVAWMKTLVPA
jgi:LL-diaminopimelate aminotransferase